MPQKDLGRGNSLGVHSFDGNETQLSPHKPATRTLTQVAGFAPLRVQGCKNFFASVPVYIEVVLEDVLLANVSLISNLPSTLPPTCYSPSHLLRRVFHRKVVKSNYTFYYIFCTMGDLLPWEDAGCQVFYCGSEHFSC